MDLYKGFAERYDQSYGTFGEYDPQMIQFFRQIFTQRDVSSVLDCACGTGRHLPLFHSLGCQVNGSDISVAMLEQAKKNLQSCRLEVELQQADFRRLPACFAQPFDSVVCLGAIGFMPSEADVKTAFGSMAQVLRPTGILILTSMPTDRQWKEKPHYILQSAQCDLVRIFAIDYFKQHARYNILDVIRSGSHSQIEVWSAELRVLLRDDQERLLLNAGFRRVDFYGSYDFRKYDKATSDNLITVAYR